MKPVLTKADFVRRYQNHEFGNRAPTWDNPQEFIEANYTQGLVHLRNRIAGGDTWYNLEPRDAISLWLAQSDRSKWYCSAMAPHEHNLLQGEVWDGPGGLYLHWSNLRYVPMRTALVASPMNTTGLRAKFLLRRVMNDLSWDWFQYLLEAYPEHVIEFSAFSCCWGTRPNENVVWWEVRKGY